MRLPVVSTAISGIGELVDHMENGLLVPEKETEALAHAIDVLLVDQQLRDHLGENGRRKVMDRFSLDRSTAKVRDLLLGARGMKTAHQVGMTQAGRRATGVPMVSQEAPPS